jgi:hypothetical protein
MKKSYKEAKEKIGCTKFIKNQYEEGVESKIKKSPCTSLFYVHKSKEC